MSEATQIAAVSVPQEVLDFAEEQGVRAELPAVIELTRRIFPGGTLGVSIDVDPEIADDRHIVIETKAVPMSVAEALEAEWRWHQGLFACCPAPLVCTFRLGLDIAP
jgi:hypothetical protein